MEDLFAPCSHKVDDDGSWLGDICIDCYRERLKTVVTWFDEMKKECAEQARLNGKGSEREAGLLAKLAESEKRTRYYYRLYIDEMVENDFLRNQRKYLVRPADMDTRTRCHHDIWLGDHCDSCGKEAQPMEDEPS